jgi:3-oxoacyl-[acyl-carrier-protein] synthase-3
MAARFLRMPMEKFYINLERYGNTSAASVPLAFCEAMDEGLIQQGSNLVLVGFGAGLTWAAAVVRFGVSAEPLPEMTLFRWVRLSRVKETANQTVGRVIETITPLLLPLYTRALRITKRKRPK